MSMYIVPREGPNYKDATPIGFISLSKPEERQIQHGNTYLTLAISKDAQGKGYGTEAIAWALDWAFDFARMHRVEIFCYSWNAGASACILVSGSARKASSARLFGSWAGGTICMRWRC